MSVPSDIQFSPENIWISAMVIETTINVFCLEPSPASVCENNIAFGAFVTLVMDILYKLGIFPDYDTTTLITNYLVQECDTFRQSICFISKFYNISCESVCEDIPFITELPKLLSNVDLGALASKVTCKDLFCSPCTGNLNPITQTSENPTIWAILIYGLATKAYEYIGKNVPSYLQAKNLIPFITKICSYASIEFDEQEPQDFPFSSLSSSSSNPRRGMLITFSSPKFSESDIKDLNKKANSFTQALRQSKPTPTPTHYAVKKKPDTILIVGISLLIVALIVILIVYLSKQKY